MKAYAILDGGGVKGAALVGALHAAAERDVQFVGFGGTSAGGIVAVLSALGFTPPELKQFVVEKQFTDFLDDRSGADLKRLISCLRTVAEGSLMLRPIRMVWSGCRNLFLLRSWKQRRGIYDGRNLRRFLSERIREKLPDAEDPEKITFADLKARELSPHESYALGKCWPLRIVASNISDRSAFVFPEDSGEDFPVVDAVMASMAYPLVFYPVKVETKSRKVDTLVDGGLCSNLPAFLFEDNARRYRLPVIAIDLVVTPTEEKESFATAVKQMIDTALDASDKLVRSLVDVHHVRVTIDPPVDTLNFDLSPESRRFLFQNGELGYSRYHQKYFKPLQNADDVVQRLQVRYGHPNYVLPILKLIRSSIEQKTEAEGVRVHVMLPTLDGDRIVVYQVGMENMSDRTLRLNENAGCSGKALQLRRPVFADMRRASQEFEAWGLTREQQDRIPAQVASMLSVPIFDTGTITPDKTEVDITKLPTIGSLSIDTVTSPPETGWITPDSWPDRVIADQDLVLFLRQWADIIGKVLS